MSASPAPTSHRIEWRSATVREVLVETPTTNTLILDVPGWPGHLAGQHVDVRLTADDGYQAARSYSIASAPNTPGLALTVEQLKDGEVSSYLCGEAGVGDQFEIRGPIGGYFTWQVADGGPLFLVAGGSGIVPLMAMLRHRAMALTTAEARAALPVRLLYSSRSWEGMIYRDELSRLAAGDGSVAVYHTITRDRPGGWTGLGRRIDREMLSGLMWSPDERPRVFVCGPTPLVELAATELVALGHEAGWVKTERFGPTGAGV